MKKIKVSIENNGQIIESIIEDSKSLLALLFEHGVQMAATCGGSGECGKCKVFVTSEGKHRELSLKEHKLLSKDEIDRGVRLACEYLVEDDISVKILQMEEDFQILSGEVEAQDCSESEHNKNYQIVIDLGTTTIVFAVIEEESKKILASHTVVNAQRPYGSDVMSRMKANVDEPGRMTTLIRHQLAKGIDQVIGKAKVQPSNCMLIQIAGNTTMEHLLLGYETTSLMSYPFKPYSISEEYISYAQLFQSNQLDCKVYIYPMISAFIGGDIVAGMSEVFAKKSGKVSLFLDLGTNGELVIGDGERFLATATAMGPAFEGGAIRCGVGGIAGAIKRVYIENSKQLQYETIDGKEPIGICGSGILDLCACLLELGYMDKTGFLCEPYFTEGVYLAENVIFTQGDIRNLQLAKGAVRAGIEILLKSYGITEDEVDTVYLAGGFGCYLQPESATKIGLIPKEFSNRISAIGNSCLYGMRRNNVIDKENIKNLCEHTKVLNLAEEEEFQNLYIEHMNFEIE